MSRCHFCGGILPPSAVLCPLCGKAAPAGNPDGTPAPDFTPSRRANPAPLLAGIAAVLLVGVIGYSLGASNGVPRRVTLPSATALPNLSPPPQISAAQRPSGIPPAGNAPTAAGIAVTDADTVRAYLLWLQDFNQKRQERNRQYREYCQRIPAMLAPRMMDEFSDAPGRQPSPQANPIEEFARVTAQFAQFAREDVTALSATRPPAPCRPLHEAYTAICRQIAEGMEQAAQQQRQVFGDMTQGGVESQRRLAGAMDDMKSGQKVRDAELARLVMAFQDQAETLRAQYPGIPAGQFTFPVVD